MAINNTNIATILMDGWMEFFLDADDWLVLINALNSSIIDATMLKYLITPCLIGNHGVAWFKRWC
ncbi:MAG: hypothetical protein ACXQS8_09260, partial [Candidatus Helarchaeales archaeon]